MKQHYFVVVLAHSLHGRLTAYPYSSSSSLSCCSPFAFRLGFPVWNGFKLPAHDLEGG